MRIKRNSIIVALVSSLIISAVLVFTLIGYLVYIELKSEDFKRSYQDLLLRVNARWYGSSIGFSGLAVKIAPDGPLAGRPVVEGSLRNTGARTIADLVIRVRLLDHDGATLYEIAFRPQEPSLGGAEGTLLTFGPFARRAKTFLKPGTALSFKKLIDNCPGGVLAALSTTPGAAGGWSGRLLADALTVEFE